MDRQNQGQHDVCVLRVALVVLFGLLAVDQVVHLLEPAPTLPVYLMCIDGPVIFGLGLVFLTGRGLCGHVLGVCECECEYKCQYDCVQWRDDSVACDWVEVM